MNRSFVLPSSLVLIYPPCQGTYSEVIPFPQVTHPNSVHFFFCCIYATCPTHIILDFMVLKISHGKWYKPQNFSIWFSLQPRPTPSLHLSLNIFISTPILKHHHSVQNVKLFINCTAALFKQPQLGRFSMPWWYMINADTNMIKCFNTKLDQWVSSHTGFFGIEKLISKKKTWSMRYILSQKRNKWHPQININSLSDFVMS